LLTAATALTTTPTHAAIFNGCGYSGGITDSNEFIPPDEINIPITGQPGDYVGPWRTNPATGTFGYYYGYPFYICSYRLYVFNNSVGPEDNIWIVGEKPFEVFLSPDINSANGYSVWTKNPLSAVGLGFILRWRVSARSDINGSWRYPPTNWNTDTPPFEAGIPFYRFPSYTISSYNPLLSWVNPVGSDNYSSVAEYRNALNNTPDAHRVYFMYGTNVEMRYILTKPASSIYSTLDDLSTNISTPIITMKQRTGFSTRKFNFIRHNLKINISPTGTCTTPSLQEATQNFNMVFASAIPYPNSTTAQRDFNFTLTNCPRVNIRYYAHANGKWVNSAQGIVGMSGSIPNANPAIGNPRGFGIQLQHRTGGHQHSGNVHIHPNEIANPPSSQSYTRNWKGAGTTNTSTGVTHTIPLRARVIRTNPSGTPIQPGPFNTSVVFVISYP